jgi:hypothetical protein
MDFLLDENIYFEGASHGGVVFIDDKTISSDNHGMLMRAIAQLWTRYGNDDWRDRTFFLQRTSE